MATYRIRYRRDGNWQGTLDGNEQPIVLSHTQALVKQEIFERARRSGDSRVLVFNAAGDEEEERTFGAARTASHGPPGMG